MTSISVAYESVSIKRLLYVLLTSTGSSRNARHDGCHTALYHNTHDRAWQTRHRRDQELCSISNFIANSTCLVVFSRQIEVIADSTVLYRDIVQGIQITVMTSVSPAAKNECE